ncbi:MAG: hypothetical protein D3906_01725 [Candidatus Electrothrix sp. AUS1_2]|nr:hypothetical protein [Candidatus Electrothrix sp. AUS1_2]
MLWSRSRIASNKNLNHGFFTSTMGEKETGRPAEQTDSTGTNQDMGAIEGNGITAQVIAEICIWCLRISGTGSVQFLYHRECQAYPIKSGQNTFSAY